jgi:hypothetical protein
MTYYTVHNLCATLFSLFKVSVSWLEQSFPRLVLFLVCQAVRILVLEPCFFLLKHVSSLLDGSLPSSSSTSGFTICASCPRHSFPPWEATKSCQWNEVARAAKEVRKSTGKRARKRTSKSPTPLPATSLSSPP